MKENLNGGTATNTEASLGISLGINATQEKILTLMQGNPSITAASISKNIGISLRSTEENIKKLRDKGILRREGTNRSGRWFVTTRKE